MIMGYLKNNQKIDMNLLDKNLWEYEVDWGTHVNLPTVNNSLDNIHWNSDGSVSFDVQYSDTPIFPGWERDANWNKVPTLTNYSAGLIISKEKYGFGTYEMNFKVPNFRGSWPAWWMFDKNKLPPEIDIFEHFRKDCFLTRFHLTTSYHDGPTYETGKSDSKARYNWLPIDWKYITIKMIWTVDKAEFYYNNKKYYTMNKSDWPYYPTTPMNILVNSGVNPDWKLQVKKISPFIVKSLTYESL
jgi:beta-glucanase (GH16 family)